MIQLLIKEQGRYISSGNVTLLVDEENPVGMWAITIYDNFFSFTCIHSAQDGCSTTHYV